MTATIPSDRPIGTCQPAQVTLGERHERLHLLNPGRHHHAERRRGEREQQ
jgi:hypothetical protein